MAWTELSPGCHRDGKTYTEHSGRQLIHDTDPEIEEEWKWEKPASPGTPVWSHDGIVCTPDFLAE